MYDDGSSLTYGINNNVSLSASETDAFDKFVIENNDTDSSFNMYALGFDTEVQTNISDIVVDGMNEGNEPQRLKSALDYIFVLSSPVRLDEFESWSSGPVKVTANSNGCRTVGETVTVYVIDKAQYKSVETVTSGQILSGMEDDAATETDVGASDFTVTFICKA